MTEFVTATGLQIKTIETILSELSTQQKAEIDATINTSPEEPQGQLNGIYATQLRELWELGQVAYNGFNPDTVEGHLQDKLNALTGTIRNPATKGTVSLDCDLVLGTVLLAGTHYANVVGEPDNRWTPTEDYTAPGGGVQAVPFQAEFAGSQIANATTITTIATPLVGWASVTNPLDAIEGLEIETHAAYRLRREEELRATGSATLDAVRADVLSDDDIEQCIVFENVTNLTETVTGLPPKTIEVVVYDGDPAALTNNEIAQLIFDTKSAGMGTFGLTSGVATDSNGFFHVINFSRSIPLEVWVDMFVSIDASVGYAGKDALKAAIVEMNATDLLSGRDVIANRLVEIAMAFEGIFDMTSPPELGFAAFPAGTTNLVVGSREIARLDTTRITVTESFWTGLP